MKPPILFFCLVALFLYVVPAIAETDATFWTFAPSPPMRWKSWDCFATTITEEQARAETDYMAGYILPFGWQSIVVDHPMFEPGAKGFHYRRWPELVMNEYERLQPAPNRYPSAANGAGFKTLADYVHAKEPKFGIHIMRGIPRQAVEKNNAIWGTKYHATDIADVKSTCSWNDDMYGVDMTKPGAQEFYDGRTQQHADWGVDFLKVNDLSQPYHQAEIEAIRKAIDKTGRAIVFFNARTDSASAKAADHRSISDSLSDLGIAGRAKVRDLWKREDLGVFKD